MKPRLPFAKSSSKANLAFIVACFSLIAPAFAVDYTWQPTTGSLNWVDAANWDPTGGPPASGDNVYINGAGNTSTALINSGDVINYNELNFTTGLINMSGGSISASANQNVGSSDGGGTTDEVTVSGGANWTTTKRFLLGSNNAALDATVSGAGTTLASYEYFIVGAVGSTTNLTLDTGAKIQKFGTNNQVIVADGAAAVATLTVNDDSSVVSAAEVKVGWNGGDATMTLNDTSTLTTSDGGAGRIGFVGGSDGTLILNEDSLASFAGEMDIARDQSSGTLEIHDTADVSVAHTLHIGRASDGGKTGTLIMDGTDTTLSVGGGLKVGHHGGDSVASMTMSGMSTATVTGGEVYIGDESATGTLTMSDDSLLSVTGGGQKFVVSRYNGKGTVTLSGNAAISTNDADVVIAENDEGALTMSDNSSITAGNGYFYIGSAATSNDGKNAATGTLTVDGGTVNAQNAMILGRKSYGTGTLNLNGGKVVANRFEEIEGAGQLNLNGGTIQANGNRTGYFGGFESADIDIQAGGLTFDTNGADVSISQDLTGDGGLSKQGTGTLTLSGAAGYLGDTDVSGGGLKLGTSLAGNLAVDDGASIAGEAAVTGSLVLGTSNGANISVDGSTAAALSVDDLTVNGYTYVDLTAVPAVVGSPINVINYTGTLILSDTLANSFELTPGTYRNPGIFANPTGSITMTVPAGDDLVWRGDSANPTFWDVNSTANWSNDPTDPDVFFLGDNVLFDDTGVSKTIDLQTLLAPASITFDNSAGNDYTFAGGGGVGFTGSTGIVKNGTGLVAIGGYGSDYTGTVTINDGVLQSNGANESLGNSSGITINDSVNGGGQLDMNGQNLGGPGRDYDFTIAGSGPDGLGAITNSNGNSPNENLGALNLTLSGNASVGGHGGRFDLGRSGAVSGTITGNGFTLTKVGTGTVGMRAPASDITYFVNGGTLKFEDSDTASGPNAIIVNSGTLQAYGDRTFSNTLNFSGGTTLDNDGGGSQTWTGPINMTGSSSDTVNLNARNGAVTLSGGVTGLSNVVLNGGNTLNLTGANTYTGNTAVNAGTLALASTGSLAFVVTDGGSNMISGGGGAATLDGTFNIDTSAVTVSSGTWTLVDTSTLTDPFGSTFSPGAGWTDDNGVWTMTGGWTFTEATGELSLGGGDSYASWIDGYFPSETDPAIIGADADPDQDGIANGVEMVVGGDPAAGMDTALLPTLELVTDPAGVPTGDYFLFTFRRADLSVAAGVASACEYDTDLAGLWATAQDGVDGVTILEDDDYGSFVPPATETDRVRVYVPRGVNSELFGRLNVLVP